MANRASPQLRCSYSERVLDGWSRPSQVWTLSYENSWLVRLAGLEHSPARVGLATRGFNLVPGHIGIASTRLM